MVGKTTTGRGDTHVPATTRNDDDDQRMIREEVVHDLMEEALDAQRIEIWDTINNELVCGCIEDPDPDTHAGCRSAHLASLIALGDTEVPRGHPAYARWAADHVPGFTPVRGRSR